MFTATRLSNRIYFGLIAALALLAAGNLFLPQGDLIPTMPTQELPLAKPLMALVVAGMMIVFYGGLGWIGLRLTRKLAWPDLWDSKISHRQRFAIPAMAGVATGLIFMIADTLYSRIGSWGRLPHPPFPTSLVASATAGIGEEIIFRLFFLGFWVWLVSHVLLKGRWQTAVFWMVAIFSALAFALGHLPAVMLLLNIQEIAALPPLLLSEILLLNGVLALLAAFCLRKYGFLAAVGIHFWADLVWHVIWGFIGPFL